MQQIAREDSDSYGATYAKMREANMVLVITRLALEFRRPLCDEDIVTIRSINNRSEGASFVREFLFFANGEQVAAATTLWALLDFEKRLDTPPFGFEIQDSCAQHSRARHSCPKTPDRERYGSDTVG